jgi:hypothetical protein
MPNMKRFFILLSLSVLPLIYLSSLSFAEEAVVMTLIEKMKNMEEITLQSAQQIEIVVKEGDQVLSRLVAGKAQKNFPDGKRVLLVILKPDTLKGFAYLFQENSDLTVDRWIYPPAIGRIKKITSAWNTFEHFLDTDFTYADLGFVDIKGEHKLLGETEMEGRPAYKIETIPQVDLRYYSRIITWISKNTYLPLRRDYYDSGNRLWKRQTFGDIIIIDDLPHAQTIEMFDLLLNRSTQLIVKEIRTDLDIPDEIFDPMKIQYALKCPIWERVCRPEDIVK